VKQLKGAERWIREHPGRVFLDKFCEIEFPITFPLIGEALIHLIVVARGASDICRRHHGHGLGSLILDPSVKGAEHWPSEVRNAIPFAIGDIDPEGSFVHVLDEVTLDIILGELDTIKDLTDYLQRKETFFRSGGMP